MALEYKLMQIIEKTLSTISTGEDISQVLQDLDNLKEDLLQDTSSSSMNIDTSELQSKLNSTQLQLTKNKIFLRKMQESLSLVLPN
jgi:hypothetical protein